MDFFIDLNLGAWMLFYTLIGIIIPTIGMLWIIRLLGGSTRKTIKTFKR